MELLNSSTNRHDLSRPASRSFYNNTRDLSLHRPTANLKLCSEYTIPLGKTVNFVAFSPFDKSSDILACGTKDQVCVFRISLPDDSQDSGEAAKFDYQIIHDYITGSKATSVAFSPNTDFSRVQDKLLNLAVAGDDFCILILEQLFKGSDIAGASDGDSSVEQHYINGHTDYINDMAFEPTIGDFLASASDDCTCCVWSLSSIGHTQKNEPDMKILLTSPGINVKWHTSEPNKLFVSEKGGLIRFYDMNSRVAVMSFECNRYPLMASDWCNDNSLYIGCCAGKDLFFWDTSLTSLPIKVIKTNSEGLSDFEFFDSKIVAFRGRPNNYLKVQNFTNNQVFIDKEFVAGRGLSWNQKLPILAVGGSKDIHIFKINTL